MAWLVIANGNSISNPFAPNRGMHLFLLPIKPLLLPLELAKAGVPVAMACAALNTSTAIVAVEKIVIQSVIVIAPMR
jgi:hypothetical protein